MKDLTVGIVGGGVVGQATARSYLEHVKRVMVYDKVPERSTCALGELLNEADTTFVCLPTPLGQSGIGLDTSAIDGFFSYVASGEPNHADGRKWRDKNFVLRSTVPIGTTRRLAQEYRLPNLVHSPEFLTARCAMVDAMMPARNMIGLPNATHRWDRELCPHGGIKGILELEKLYKDRFPSIKVHRLNSDESEATKLFQNGFFAAKIAYWNECRTLADKLGLDWESVMGAILADGRIHPSHTQVPGPDGKRGFGPDTPSACLPKDIVQLIVELDRNGLRADVTSAAILRNGYDRDGGQS